MGNGEILRYERFTNAFFDYANQRRVDGNNYNNNYELMTVIEIVRDFQEGKSLVALLSRTDDIRIRDDPEFKFEVPFKTFSQKIRRHHGQVHDVSKTQEEALEKLITTKEGVVDLVKL